LARLERNVIGFLQVCGVELFGIRLGIYPGINSVSIAQFLLASSISADGHHSRSIRPRAVCGANGILFHINDCFAAGGDEGSRAARGFDIAEPYRGDAE